MGYDASMTATEKLIHHKRLEKMLPEKKKELEYAYKWMSNRNFLDAVSSDSPTQYDYACKTMLHPPQKLLKSLKKNSSNPQIQLVTPSLNFTQPTTPKCNLCEEKLADTIRDKINYSVVKCNCGQQWCHVKCTEKLLMNRPQCMLCKKYFTLTTMKNSSLQQTLLRF